MSSSIQQNNPIAVGLCCIAGVKLADYLGEAAHASLQKQGYSKRASSWTGDLVRIAAVAGVIFASIKAFRI